nr:hypothetical protein [Tanacetum cinerariifolium]
MEEKRRKKCEKKESGEQKEKLRSFISPKPNSSVFQIPGDFTVGSSRFSDFTGKVPYLVTSVAFLSTHAIVRKMALGVLEQVSPIWFPFTRPYILDLGD